MPYWLGVLNEGYEPGKPQYAELIKRVFCWSLTYLGCSKTPSQTTRQFASRDQVASKATRRFALRNGTDTISATFKDPSVASPPAVRVAGDAGCSARGMSGSVDGGFGELSLVLRCHGLKRGAEALARIGEPVEDSFRLRRGNGSIRVQLAKPPGTVKPLVYLGYGPAKRTCGHGGSRLRMRARTFVISVNARCGRAAGNAMAHLYIGGLLQ